MTRRFIQRRTRSYASNRKYRERGNSEISVNERILRQAAIKELVSLRRLRALLCDQFENWHVRTNMFKWSCRLCISLRFERWKMRERGCRGRMRRKRSSSDNLIIPTPDRYRYVLAARDIAELTGSGISALRFQIFETHQILFSYFR